MTDCAVFCFSRQGVELSLKIKALLHEHRVQIYTIERLIREDSSIDIIPSPSKPFYKEQFQSRNLLIFVGALGIAVRSIAAFVSDKRSDPAVLCIDDRASFVIPVLSGHIGGANAYALLLASKLNAQAVITTATDVNKRFSVDSWAVKEKLAISDMKLAKDVSAKVLEGRVPIKCELPVKGSVPESLSLSDEGSLGIYLGYYNKQPFEKTLCLIPKILSLGIGCRRGISKEQIRAAVDYVFQKNNLNRQSLVCAASVDLKQDEQGLIAFCKEEKLPFYCYSAEALNAAKGNFSYSAFVEKTIGVGNVCERAAMLAAKKFSEKEKEPTLIISKYAMDGVTIAVAAAYKEVCFE